MRASNARSPEGTCAGANGALRNGHSVTAPPPDCPKREALEPPPGEPNRARGRQRPPGPYFASIFVIFSLRAGPRGTGTETISPRFLPSSALPIGDSFESLFSEGFASEEPTILYGVDLLVFWSLTWTVTPTVTASFETAFSSITDAARSLSSSSAI